MKSFTKQLIFISTAIIIFGAGVLAVIAVNNRGSAPVAYWKLDEGYGSTTYDSAGSNDGAITDAAWRNEPDCKSGKCLSFDGVDDYVDTADIDLSSPFTVSAWIYDVGSQTSYARVLSKQSSYIIDYDNTENIRFGVGDGSWYFSPTVSMSDNEWTFIAGVFDGSDLTIYKNAVSDSNSYGGGAMISNDYNFMIGGDSDRGTYFNGLIDDVRIYNYARTASQIKADYLGGSARGSAAISNSQFSISKQSEGLVGHWKMDETSWTVDCSTDTVMDSSGNSKHGDACPASGGLAPAAGKYGNAGSFDGSDDYVEIPDIDF